MELTQDEYDYGMVINSGVVDDIVELLKDIRKNYDLEVYDEIQIENSILGLEGLDWLSNHFKFSTAGQGGQPPLSGGR